MAVTCPGGPAVPGNSPFLGPAGPRA
jgi:hypothetical protein